MKIFRKLKEMLLPKKKKKYKDKGPPHEKKKKLDPKIQHQIDQLKHSF